MGIKCIQWKSERGDLCIVYILMCNSVHESHCHYRISASHGCHYRPVSRTHHWATYHWHGQGGENIAFVHAMQSLSTISLSSHCGRGEQEVFCQTNSKKKNSFMRAWSWFDVSMCWNSICQISAIWIEPYIGHTINSAYTKSVNYKSRMFPCQLGPNTK